MSYNWKCCSFYPNNFGASALFNEDFHVYHRPVVALPLGSGSFTTGLW